MDASADKRWTSLLTATDILSRRDKPAPEQQSQRAQQASRTAAETLAEEPALFQTLDEELAALLSIDLERPGSALAQARPNTGGLPRNDGPAPTAFTSAASDAAPVGASPTPEGLFGSGGRDEQDLLFQAASAPAGPPAPPASSPPPSPTAPRRRTTGPSRPARPRGSLAFGGSALSGAGGGAGCSWATYGEASVAGTTVTLGEDRPQTGSQPMDVHGASLLLPAAGQYTIYFDVDLSTWDSYNEDRGEGTGTGYYDSFSVSVTGVPYPELAWTDPVPLPFVWGGQRYGDELETRTGPVTVTVAGDPGGANYLNVVLDTFSQDHADTVNPSWGTVVIARVTADGVNIPPVAHGDSYRILHDTTLVADGVDELDVLFNDCNLDGDPLTARLVSPPAVGNLSFNPDGTFTYTPPPTLYGAGDVHVRGQ